MCTSWNWVIKCARDNKIITYWEMCTSWNRLWLDLRPVVIITYWEMCTNWNLLTSSPFTAIILGLFY